MYVFRTPIRNSEGPRTVTRRNRVTGFDDGARAPRLMQLVRHHSGYPVAVLVTAGVVSEIKVPTTSQIAEADFAYLGGRDHVISDDEAAVLIGAGYAPVPL